jgi:hypothetical protein
MLGVNTVKAHEGRDCTAAKIQRIAKNAPRWPDIISRGLGSPSVDPIAMCYPRQG